MQTVGMEARLCGREDGIEQEDDMKTIKFRGRRIKPNLVIGADEATGEYMIVNDEPVSPQDICLFFMAIAKLNGRTIEEMAQLLIRGANHLLEDDPELMGKVKAI